MSAREIVTREYLDVVLTDIRMPRLDGVQLLKVVRDLAPDVIVLMMTAHWTPRFERVDRGPRVWAPRRCSRSRSATSTW